MDVKVDATFEMNDEWLARFEKAALAALDKTAEALKSDLVLSGTMPKDTGALEGPATTVNRKWLPDGLILLASSTPYARKLFWHPEYNFRQDKNPKAGGRWFDVYLKGYARERFIPDTFEVFLEKELSK